MAVSQVPFRSISLPARLHPINSTGLEAELQKLKSCVVSKAVSITSETIQSGLLGLVELYNSVEELTQQSLQDEKSIEGSLGGSVELLDSCSTIRELVQMIRENVRSLQSSLRRKGPERSGIQSDVASYFCFRKKLNKCISKSLKKLKNLENKNESSDPSLDGLTIAIFKCVFLFLSWPAARPGGWSLVSRLMLTKSERDHGVVTEVGCLDSALNVLRNGDSKVVDVQMVLKSMQNLDDCLEGIELRLERLFRGLVQNRVRLLNILTDR